MNYNSYLQNQKNKDFNFNNKLEYLKNELLDKEKCRKFSLKLCEYIKENPKN